MTTNELIESYVNDVAMRLPRKIRKDVGFELRALLNDELSALEESAGRALDDAAVIDMLREFGRPEDVAGRYAPRGYNIIEPEHGPLFVRLTLAAIAIQWLFTLPGVFMERMTWQEWWMSWGWGALWWPGLFVVYFGAATWIRRRWPVDPASLERPGIHWLFWLPETQDWRPVDQQRELRSMAMTLLPLSAVLIVLFVSPAAVLSFVWPGDADTSWARYDPGFQGGLLIPILIVMVARFICLSLAVIDTTWRVRTERLRFGLWVVFVVLLLWADFGIRIFASDATNLFFKVWLFVFLLVNVIQIGVWVRRAMARVPEHHIGKA